MIQEESWKAFDEVVAGAKKIQTTTVLAQNDITFAEGRLVIVGQMASSLAATKAAMASWNPSATYKASDLTAIKGQLINIVDQLTIINTALNELYSYRKANDQSTIDINNALIWIAKQLLGGQGEGLIP